jgi:hypothetical protein
MAASATGTDRTKSTPESSGAPPTGPATPQTGRPCCVSQRAPSQATTGTGGHPGPSQASSPLS